MSGETVVPIVGNLTADPELRYTQTGKAVANFTIASTPRQFDRVKNEWADSDKGLFLRCTVWGDYAEHVCRSLKKGMRVMALGYLEQSAYEKDGVSRVSTDLVVQEIGPVLRYATADVARVVRAAGGSDGFIPDGVDVVTGELVGS